MTQWRAQFDADVAFLNGGALAAHGFRIDVQEPELSADEVGRLFVRHLGLLMVGDVGIRNLEFLAEPHKGTRGVIQAVEQPRKTVDLSHPIEAGMVTYPGLPGPEIGAHLSREESRSHYEEGTEFLIGRVTMVGNTGTYIDSPFHRFADGADLAALPLDRIADVPGVVVRLAGSATPGIPVSALSAIDVAGRAVLLHTGWDEHWRTERYGHADHPHLSAEAAAWLAESGAALVGIDSVNIDGTTGGDRPAHTALLRAGIPVVEHLTGLENLPTDGFRFHAAPAPLRAFGTLPVRAYAVIASA